MRNLFLLYTCFFLPLLAHAQVFQDDFEGNGNISTWAGDDCGLNTSFANPLPGPANPSANVLRYHDTGGLYANVRFDLPANLDLSTGGTFSVAIYVPASGLTGNSNKQLSLKLQNNTLPQPWITQSEVIKPLVLNTWQVLTFNFSTDPYVNLDPTSPPPATRNDFNRVLLQVNGENNNDQVLAYMDNISFSSNALPPVYTELVWSDEFSGSGAIDGSKWHHQTQLPNGTSWYNNEQQHYTNRVQNSFQDSGYLHIMARRETFTDQGQTKLYTSARLNSRFAFTYGRVEVRAKLPFGAGTWPAIWMLGKNVNEPGGYWQPQYGNTPWPACGEVDIMEHWGNNQNYISSALHTPSSFGGTVNVSGFSLPGVSDNFHVYGLEWTPEKMMFSVDNNVFYTYAPAVRNADTWPFDADQYLLLNVAMQPAIDPNFVRSPMIIDYVRVYQEPDTTTSVDNPSLLPGIKLFPNPSRDQLNIVLPENLLGARIQVYSSLGQLMHTGTQRESQAALDCAAYPDGVYRVLISSPLGQHSSSWLKR
ncbi:MAG: glycosyl hydrolase family protein [Bacteroidetes bacterium]|nr:MAG: glycosyl hydrolase family protein [Bacteroidota bacterium]